MIISDYHVHTSFSFDSKAIPEQSVARAVAAGLDEVALTDHYEPYPADPNSASYDPVGYFAEIERLRSEFGDRIKIISGVEVGQAHRYTDGVKALLDKYPYDFVIGSVHFVNGGDDLAFMNYSMSNKRKWLETYFFEAAQAAETGLYDVFGHLNYICRYVRKKKVRINIRDYSDLAEILLRKIITAGKGIEINVSTLRTGGNTALPPVELIEKFRALGGETITVGSDAHTPSAVGAHILRGITLAKRGGFKYIAQFEQRKLVYTKIDL